MDNIMTSFISKASYHSPFPSYDVIESAFYSFLLKHRMFCEATIEKTSVDGKWRENMIVMS